MITLIGSDRPQWPCPVIGRVGRTMTTTRAALYVRISRLCPCRRRSLRGLAGP
jgi:hypothetical protein